MHDLAAMIGKRIREVRNVQGISLEELSFKAGLNAAHLGQIERQIVVDEFLAGQADFHGPHPPVSLQYPL